MNIWPTPLEPDGTAPVLLKLLSSSDAFLVRQAMYLAAVAAALKNSGYELKVVQQHVVGNGTRLTVPLIVKNANKQRVAIYTNSEAWTTESFVHLLSWIRDLVRAWADTMPVIVIAQHDSDEVKGLRQAFQFIHMPEVDGAMGEAPLLILKTGD